MRSLLALSEMTSGSSASQVLLTCQMLGQLLKGSVVYAHSLQPLVPLADLDSEVQLGHCSWSLVRGAFTSAGLKQHARHMIYDCLSILSWPLPTAKALPALSVPVRMAKKTSHDLHFALGQYDTQSCSSTCSTRKFVPVRGGLARLVAKGDLWRVQAPAPSSIRLVLLSTLNNFG